ncbi:hypothetical protein HPB48_007200 [Haemaphysalis longicornis]|uniref:Uncharacterized protein n=1 Tax=Haemaphysalis longicornis TaxID=44386 RepID=A0A9J6FTE1_HAELO|nr:hypothetical protein HPB48_007200 [Haemaphysalis longicornis]
MLVFPAPAQFAGLVRRSREALISNEHGEDETMGCSPARWGPRHASGRGRGLKITLPADTLQREFAEEEEEEEGGGGPSRRRLCNSCNDLGLLPATPLVVAQPSPRTGPFKNDDKDNARAPISAIKND